MCPSISACNAGVITWLVGVPISTGGAGRGGGGAGGGAVTQPARNTENNKKPNALCTIIDDPVNQGGRQERITLTKKHYLNMGYAPAQLSFQFQSFRL